MDTPKPAAQTCLSSCPNYKLTDGRARNIAFCSLDCSNTKEYRRGPTCLDGCPNYDPFVAPPKNPAACWPHCPNYRPKRGPLEKNAGNPSETSNHSTHGSSNYSPRKKLKKAQPKPTQQPLKYFRDPSQNAIHVPTAMASSAPSITATCLPSSYSHSNSYSASYAFSSTNNRSPWASSFGGYRPTTGNAPYAQAPSGYSLSSLQPSSRVIASMASPAGTTPDGSASMYSPASPAYAEDSSRKAERKTSPVGNSHPAYSPASLDSRVCRPDANTDASATMDRPTTSTAGSSLADKSSRKQAPPGGPLCP